MRWALALGAVHGSVITFNDLHQGARTLQPPLGEVEPFHALDRVLDSRLMVKGEEGYRFPPSAGSSGLHADPSDDRMVQLRAALERAADERPRKAGTPKPAENCLTLPSAPV